MPAAQEPIASVVVATYNRSPLLARLVGALAAQRGDLVFEMVVVDDASTDDTWAELQGLAATAPFPLRALRLDRNGGPGRARNVGWRTAVAPLVVFTDDDCEPMPGWLAAMVAAGADADVVQGATFPNPDDYHSRRRPFSYTLRITAPSPWFETCNMAYSRAWLERLSGFDETFRSTAGEDTDLGWRAREAGARFTFAPRAGVLHDVRPEGFLDRVRDARRWGSVPRLVHDHPPLRGHLSGGWFRKRSHPPALLAAAGLAIALTPARWLVGTGGLGWRAVLAAGAAAPYVAHRLRGGRLPGRLRGVMAMPLALVVDLAEIVVLAWGSRRYRALVL
jgi:cellulose synthase/poly-beta-1,6-N-acetylglucosamine synthase-like glycosyltransferase